MMHILYFASLREALGSGSEDVIPPPEIATVADLVKWLQARGGRWAETLSSEKRWRVAVNRQLVDLEARVKAGDEIAFFPPVTGG